MTAADNRILETLASGLRLTPAVVAENSDYTRNYVNKRVRKLTEEGLIERVRPGYYAITDRGRAYLEGELSREQLE